MTPTPKPSQRPPRRPAVGAGETSGERLWRGGFFYVSAAMGAMAMVDFDAGRFAHGLGDAGIACLMLSCGPWCRPAAASRPSRRARRSCRKQRNCALSIRGRSG